MEKDTRMLYCLLEYLEDVRKKLLDIKNKTVLLSSPITKEKCRSYANMKNVLDSLVRKTIEGKSNDHDIALIYSESSKVLFEQPKLESLLSSEEFLEEIRSLMNTTLKNDVLQKYFLTFQELLGDILFSLCQINNYRLKISSGITVRDIVEIKDLYLSIGELIFGNKHYFNKLQRKSTDSFSEQQTTLEVVTADLQKSLQSCLKEMSKVKLEIEHYFKFNIIEMQFIEANSQNEIAENVTTKSGCSDQTRQMTTPSISSKENTSNGVSESIISVEKLSSDEVIENFPPKLFPRGSEHSGFKQNDIDSFLFPPKTGLWKDKHNFQPKKEPCPDFLNHSLIYPQDFLFLDPTTVFIKSNVSKNNSLPRIYSVSSVNEESTKDFCTSLETESDREGNSRLVGEKKFRMEIKDSVGNVSPTTNLKVECLFHKNINVKRSESQSVDLQKKISSLFEQWRKNEIHNEEDIFDTTQQKIETNVLGDSKPKRLKKSVSAKKDNVNNKFGCDGQTNSTNIKLKHKNCENISSPTEEKNKTCNRQFDKTQNYSYVPVAEECPVKLAPSSQSDFIYDKTSLIELFKTTEMSQASNSGSYPQEKSSYGMWPVAAEYKYVSKERVNGRSRTVSDDNSISLTKSFEKSFFSLHLNKRYEQKQLYDGDLLVLENPDDFRYKGSSSYSLMNESFLPFNTEQIDCRKEKAERPCHIIFDEGLNIKKALAAKKGDTSKAKNKIELQKTLAVHYADCSDSFMVNKQDFQRENFDFLKINGFDDSNNWNSFISIFTSKVGPSTRINHHRMFRKVLNNIKTEQFPVKNPFSNVHTLTSNGGPFRLFDLNGYPLTDSAGNVLKDPYGKSIVQLDSTGFPKNNVKVFDAAGNSPKDINFDPTQKPKANSIIIKLTDNFKRPLRLFDKYGRPLTDCCGKLLVNIHGRPLLRFDNFGRPNTDYRGGPLYTDNGFRWSYKTGGSLSNEQLIDTVMVQKKTKDLECEQLEDSCEPINFEKIDLHLDKKEFDCCEPQGLFRNKINPLIKNSSEIWIKVENILQTLPKRKTTNTKVSQSSMIVNNVSITKNAIEKEFLKSIIYHNNIEHQESCNKYETNPNFDNIGEQTKCLTKNGHCEHTPIAICKKTVEFPLHENILVRGACSKCNAQNHTYNMSNQQASASILHGNPLINDDGEFLSKNSFVANSMFNRTNEILKNSSMFTFKNYGYLNNLCNEILKSQIDYPNKIPPRITTEKEMSKKFNWADTSYVGYTSSATSKYTTEAQTTSESPYVFTDPCGRESRPTKRNQDHGNGKECSQPKNVSIDNLCDPEQLKSHCDYFKSKRNLRQNLDKTESKGKKGTERCWKNNLQSSTDETALSIQVKSQRDKHYEIKVAERIMNELESQLVKSNWDKNYLSNGRKNKLTKASEIPKLDVLKQKYNYDKIKNQNQNYYCCDKKEPKRDSPFRFSSDIQMKNTGPDYKPMYTQDKYEINSDINLAKHNTWTKEVENDEARHINKDLIEVKNEITNKEKTRVYDPISNTEVFNKKAASGSKNRNSSKKNFTQPKPQAPTSKDCNLVSFFGSPVRYVLNKLDSKRLSKKSIKPIKKYGYKEDITQFNHPASPNKNKTINETKIRTLYENSSLRKEDALLHTEKDRTDLKQRGKLIAFRSKSCTELLGRNLTMSYSGNKKNSENTNLEEHFKHIPSCTTNLKKCVSETSCQTWSRHGDNYPLRKHLRYNQYRPQHCQIQSYFKPLSPRKKYKQPHQGWSKNSEDSKKPDKRRLNISVATSKNKAREFNMFKRSAPTQNKLKKRK